MTSQHISFRPELEIHMAQSSIERTDPSGGKSDASPSGTGFTPTDNAAISRERHARIAALAYELARRRNFAPGRELADWLEAERQIEFGPPRSTPPDNPGGPVRT